MDQDTIKKLLQQAHKNCDQSKRRFEKHDNVEDLRALEGWDQTIIWLENYLD